MRHSLTILMYHYVRPIAESDFPNIRGLELTDFEGQLDYIERHYNVVTMADVVAQENEGRPLVERPLLLSFDDGYADHYCHVFPALARRKMTGVFFVPGGAVLDRHMLDVNKIHFLLAATDDREKIIHHIEDTIEGARSEFGLLPLDEYKRIYWQANRFDSGQDIYIKRMLQLGLPEILRNRIVDSLFSRYVSQDVLAFADDLYVSEQNLVEMRSAGMEIGSHGYGHYWLDNLNIGEQAIDIDRSLEMIERIGMERHGFYFCYPYGGYTNETVDLLRARGCSAAVTTRVAIARLDSKNLLELPRLDTNDLPKDRAAPLSPWTEEAIMNNL
jgi:peptidoglycan/xylan/chitin deacetylase (PgdA/CDA1 family)